jgi:hypothetical protein
VRRRRIRQGVDGGRGVCVPGCAEWALAAAGSVIGKMQTWALLSLSLSLHSNSAAWICNAEVPIPSARPPVTRTHTLALTFPANLSPSSLIFALSPASSSSLSLSRSSKPHLHLLFARVKKRFLSLWCIHTLAALRTRGRAQNPETRRSLSPSRLVRFCACLAYPLGWLMSTGFLLSQRLLQTTSRAAEYLFGAAVTQRDFFLGAFCVLVLFGSTFLHIQTRNRCVLGLCSLFGLSNYLV